MHLFLACSAGMQVPGEAEEPGSEILAALRARQVNVPCSPRPIALLLGVPARMWVPPGKLWRAPALMWRTRPRENSSLEKAGGWRRGLK